MASKTSHSYLIYTICILLQLSTTNRYHNDL